MTDRKGDNPRTLLGTAFKTGSKAWSTASSALKSQPVKKLRGGLKSVVVGIAGVTRFVRANSIRGLLKGQLTVSESSLNQWFSRVEPPDGVSGMSLRCRPSRLVLVMSFERKLFMVPLGKQQVELPFEVEHISVDRTGGTIELRLDRGALPELRGFIKPIVMRLLSRAAADLLDDHGPLEHLERDNDVIRREGDLLIIDVGRYPPFIELMNRELRVMGGRSLFPFRALAVHGVRVTEGKLILLTRIDRALLSSLRGSVLDDVDALAAGDDSVQVTIAKPSSDGLLDD